MADVNVYVIDNSRWDVVMFLDSAVTLGEVPIKNVKEMVTKILKRCAHGDKIAELRIVGHGNEFGQYVGADWLDSDTIRRYRSDLFKLVPFFGKNGHVIMGGCKVGRNGSFLLKLSNYLNVPVTGFTASQRPLVPGDEGGSTTCFLTCTRTGKKGFDYLDN
jgi:hypothetical protein